MKTLCLLLLVSITAAYARLNETEEQCTARYGKPLSRSRGHSETGAAYNANGIGIEARFDSDGKCCRLTFTRLSKTETDKTLATNGTGWKKTSANAWQSAEGYTAIDDGTALTIRRAVTVKPPQNRTGKF